MLKKVDYVSVYFIFSWKVMMKRLFILIMLFPPILAYTQILDIGDNMSTILDENPPTLFSKFDSESLLPEENVTLYFYNNASFDEQNVFVSVDDNYIIGVLRDDKFLLDMSGDGVLDSEFFYIVIPFWVIAYNTSEESTTSDNTWGPFLDKLYLELQKDDSIFENGGYGSIIDEIYLKLIDTSVMNRDILYCLYSYNKLRDDHLWAAAQALAYLSKNYTQRYGQDHPLLMLYSIESAIGLGFRNTARSVVDSLLKYFPDCVPALAYQYILERDSVKKSILLDDLKKDHGDHWMVKDLK